MTDKQLLEYAAKAQGWIDYPNDSIEYGDTWHIEPDKAPLGKIIKKANWNPLTDDGDALRLAVKLKVDVFFHPSKVVAHIAGGRIPSIRYIAGEEYSSDPYAATRRAIVRAAAESGKGME